MDESGVYYTSLGFPSHHPDNLNNQQQGYPRDALKKCSVKGCTNALSPDDTNKMCDGCRSRHRIYASTKRARRKLEKAAIVTAVAARNGKDAEEVSSFIDPTSQPITWVTAGGQSHQDLRPSTLSALSVWNHAIDPRLFSGDVSPTSPHHLSPLMPHQTSTSSELANALTPRQPSTPLSAPAFLPNQTATNYSKHYQDPSATQHKNSQLQIPRTSVRDNDDSEHNDSEQQAATLDQHMGVSSSDRQTSSETAELSQGRSSDEVDGSAQLCSIKNCKAVISASYEYKMCPTCRTQSRTYGNAKRAKWKADRDSFDEEMEALRTAEDEKRKAKGLTPLAESPEDLRAWELLMIDELAPVSPVETSTALLETSTVAEPGLVQSLSPSPALMNPSMAIAGVYPPSIASSPTADSSHVIPTYHQLNNNLLVAAAATTSLVPARMCTMSHCHKILPGNYRYKRCEQHRLQNRHHSQLKRVREKEVKAVGPGEKATERMDKEKEKQEAMQATVALGKETGISSMTGGVAEAIKSHDQTHSKFSCSAGECHNLLLSSARWQLCEPCRTIDRRRKNQLKTDQKATAEKDEKMDANPGAISEKGGVAEGDGEAQKLQEINHAISAGAVDPDAEGDIDMGENEDETEPKAVENQQIIVAPMAPPPLPPASMTSGFSRFHVTIDPRNASSSAALDPTTSTAKLVTLDDPLAFRAYRPKTTPSAIGRILARNPGLSVDAFTEVLQAEGASADVMTLNQANATSATKSTITPTIPTSPPFVYKAPEKKNPSTRASVEKGKRKATSSDKQPTSSSTKSATPAPSPSPASASGVSESTASAPPGSYGSYGYPQYPYPYPYYMPSPYGMPVYPYPQAPPPAPSATKQKPSSKSSTSEAASSSSPTHVPPSAAIGYPPYPYPYAPQPYGYLPLPNGYPYMTTRYVPGQQPLPPGSSVTSPYPYPYHHPPVLPSTSILTTSTMPAPFPKTATAARERQRTQDTKFNYYHYGAGSSDSPTTPNDKRRKRRKVDPDYLEKFKAQTEAISMSLAMDQARRSGSSSVLTLPPASVASSNSNVAPPIASAQPVLAVDAEAPSKPITPTRPCVNKTCHRSLPVDKANTLCVRCRLRLKKHQARTKKRFKLEPRKSLLIGKAMSDKRGSVDESIKSKDSVEVD